jgi:hypothetical protein
MAQSLYIRPIAFAQSPQSEEGEVKPIDALRQLYLLATED